MDKKIPHHSEKSTPPTPAAAPLTTPLVAPALAATDETTDQALDIREIGGRKGPEPTRYGDWELAGKCVDF